MTSKEALSDLSFLAIGNENHTIKCKEVIEKDLEELEEHRKIEKEMGIDLITLFKALKDGFYFKYKDKILSSNDYFLQITVDLRDNWTFDIISGHLSLLSIKFKDYNKTWALDKQTLEK